MENHCLCEFFEKIPKGSLVSAQFRNQQELRFIFNKIEGHCVTGQTLEGCIMFDCREMISVACLPCIPNIIINDTLTINCTGVITGLVLCSGLPIANAIVNLSSPNPNIQIQTPVITNFSGVFTSNVTISEGTPSTSNVPITAETIINGETISDTIFVTIQCISCVSPVLTLDVDATIECGGLITGTLTCDNQPLGNIPVTLTLEPENNNISIFPNPAFTDNTGTYSAEFFITPVVEGDFTLTASATVGNQLLTESTNISINCDIEEECPCKFQLISSSQPGAQITITQGTNVEQLTGFLNITVIQCGTNPNMPCNPAIDNFNFTFNAQNGRTYQFTQGRRIQIVSCDPVVLQGVIQGSVDGGPKETYLVTITATLNNGTITWTITANNGSDTTFETTVPFVASAQNSFVGTCS